MSDIVITIHRMPLKIPWWPGFVSIGKHQIAPKPTLFNNFTRSPAVSHVITLTPRKSRTQVSYGDLARSNFSGDYDPKLLRTEAIDNQQYYVLELTANDKSVTYHRVLYWIDSTNSRPYKAEFYTISGRHLKTCWYQNFIQVVGSFRPTILIMEDALKGEKSTLEYSGFLLRDLPEKYFTKDYLKKLY